MADNTITIDQLNGKETIAESDLFYTRSASGEDTKTTAAQVKEYVKPEDATASTGGLVSTEDQTFGGKKTFQDGVKTSTLEVENGETVNGTLTVNGDIIVNGEEKKIEVQTLEVKDNIIVTRDGAETGLAVGELSGIKAKNYDGTHDGILAFDKDGIARVGDEGDLQPLATRTENPGNGSLAVWNTGTNRYEPLNEGTEGQILVSKGEGLAPEFQTHPKTSIESVVQTSTSEVSGGTNIITCTLNDGTSSEFQVKNGKGITKIEQTTKSTEDGGTNVWTATLSDGTTSSFEVKNGTGAENLIDDSKYTLTNVLSALHTKMLVSASFDINHPVGEIYVQFPGKKAPSALYGQGRWEDVTSEYAGLFFRAAGGNAAEFGIGEDGNIIVQNDAYKSHTHSMSHTHSVSPTSGKSFVETTNASSAAPSLYNGKSANWQAYKRDQFNTGGASTSNTGSAGSTETRPINTAIRIWERKE